MKKYIVFIFCFILLFAGCRQAYIDKQHIRSAESLIGESPDRAREELGRIAEIDYLKLSPKWRALYTYLQCQIADRLETGFPFATEVNAALRWYIKKGNPRDIVALSQFLGRAYMAEKDYVQATNTFLEGIHRAEKAGLINEAGYLNSYLADVYLHNYNFQTALAKYDKAADYFLKAGNLRSYGFAKRDMGFTYDALELYPEALTAMHEADSIGKLLNDSLIQSTVLNGLANIYLSMEEYDQAIHYILLKSPKTGNTSLYDQMTLTEAYIESGRLTEARQILDTMLQDSIPEIFRRDIYYYYYMIHSKENDYKEALSDLEKHNDLLDKYLREKENHNYIEVEKRYNHLNLTMQMNELIIGKQRNLLLAGFLSLLFLLLLSIYLYKSRKANKLLADQEKQINDNQRKIVSLSRELEKKKKEVALVSGEIQKQREEEIEQLKAGLLQTRENMIRQSPLRKKLLLKIKNFKPADTAYIDADTQAQMELEADMIYPDLIVHLSRQYPALTDADLQYCVLCLYEFDPQQEAILLGIDAGSVSKRRSRIGKRLQTSFKENNLAAFLKYYSLNP